MKVVVLLALVLSLSACCFNQKKEYGDGFTKTEIETRYSQAYPEHFLACRDNKAEDVERILNKVKALEGDAGVVLYFHGGLSHQGYMTDTLGPQLMESVFDRPIGGGREVKDALYPIFVNYDAGILDIEWGRLLSEMGRIKASDAFNELEGVYGAALLDAYQKNNQMIAPDMQEAALDVFRQARAAADLSELDDKKLSKYIRKVLEDDSKVPEELINWAEQEEGLKYSVQKFDSVSRFYAKSAPELPMEKTNIPAAEVALFRTIGRFALGTDHGIVPTLMEETTKWLGIDQLGVFHWNKVKRHAADCFAPKSNGRRLIDGLLAIQAERQQQDGDLPINTLSHSAGSIPTAHLVKYLAGKQRPLNSAVMLVPAISQELLLDVVEGNEAGYKQLYSYVLDYSPEREDSVVGVYPASLLYLVSGVAEESWYSDKMLLLAQHLDKNRRPYKSKAYRCATCEDADEVWAFFEEDKNNLVYYPGDNFTVHADKGPSHECTKYPWATPDLAWDVLKNLGLDAPVDIVTPVEGKRCKA